MNPLFHLFLGHFIADYPLQPNKLVKLKLKSCRGLFIHTAIHLAVLIIMLLPFLHLRSVWVGIAIIFVTHTFIDYTKIILEKKHKNLRLPLYLLDQTLHLVIIALVAYFIGVLTPNLPAEWMSFYADRSVVLYVLILVITTYFYDITRHFIRTIKKPTPYKRDYMMMLRNVFIVSIAFAVYWLS